MNILIDLRKVIERIAHTEHMKYELGNVFKTKKTGFWTEWYNENEKKSKRDEIKSQGIYNRGKKIGIWKYYWMNYNTCNWEEKFKHDHNKKTQTRIIRKNEKKRCAIVECSRCKSLLCVPYEDLQFNKHYANTRRITEQGFITTSSYTEPSVHLFCTVCDLYITRYLVNEEGTYLIMDRDLAILLCACQRLL